MITMLVLFPCDPLSPREVEADFADESAAAKAAGFDIALIDFDAIIREGNLSRALRFVPEGTGVVLYRSWMLKSLDYGLLYAALAERGWALLNSPADYAQCHEIPGWVAHFAGLTPETHWLPQSEFSDESFCSLLRRFGGGPLIVKDYVKSCKHNWHEACFIPDAADETAALRIMNRCVELRGDMLNGGVVLRRFVPLEVIGEHPRVKMSMGREWRFFVCNGAMSSWPYWGQQEIYAPDLAGHFAQAMSQISSRFWTMDVARTQTGEWLVLELGDGQVSGLPDGANADLFYQWLAATLKP